MGDGCFSEVGQEAGKAKPQRKGVKAQRNAKDEKAKDKTRGQLAAIRSNPPGEIGGGRRLFPSTSARRCTSPSFFLASSPCYLCDSRPPDPECRPLALWALAVFSNRFMPWVWA